MRDHPGAEKLGIVAETGARGQRTALESPRARERSAARALGYLTL
jgi:hypothetical protein